MAEQHAAEPQQKHPAIHHYRQAARHLDDAALEATEAAAHHERSEHDAVAGRQAAIERHVGEAQAHVREAKQAHARRASQGG